MGVSTALRVLDRMVGASVALQEPKIVVERTGDGVRPGPAHRVLARADGVERLPEIENSDAVRCFVVVGKDRMAVGSGEIVHRIGVVADIAAHEPRARAFLRLAVAERYAALDRSVIGLAAGLQCLAGRPRHQFGVSGSYSPCHNSNLPCPSRVQVSGTYTPGHEKTMVDVSIADSI